jgi:hypothetical protein
MLTVACISSYLQIAHRLTCVPSLIFQQLPGFDFKAARNAGDIIN